MQKSYMQLTNHFTTEQKKILLDELYSDVFNSYWKFVKCTFKNSIEGRKKFKLHWSNQELCEYLELAAKGEIEWLLISLPRGYGKSIFTSEFYPAWCLLRDPSERIGCFTRAFTSDSQMWHNHSYQIYNCALAKKLHTNLHQTTYSDRIWKTKANGYRRIGSCQTSSVGSDMTKVVIDDPHSEEHERSEALQISLDNFYRKGIFPAIRTVNQDIDISQLTNEQKEEYLFTRKLENEIKTPSTPPVLVHTMQRLHKRDMQGVMLEIIQELKNAGITKNAYYYSLPAIAPERKTVVFPISKIEYTINEGEYLEAGTLNKQVIKEHKVKMGNITFEAQMQQNPQDGEGCLIHAEWIKYDTLNNIRSRIYDFIYISCDTAQKMGKLNDYTAIIVWGVLNNRYYILDLHRKKLETPELRRLISDLYFDWGADRVLIEDHANGTSIISELKRGVLRGGKSIDMKLEGIKVNTDKGVRLQSCTMVFSDGLIIIPEDALWRAEFVRELTSFPYTKHDDQVDAVSLFLNWHRTSLKPIRIFSNYD